MNDNPTELEYAYLTKRVLQLTGLDLSGYKQEQTQRRLRALMLRFRVTGYAALVHLLEHNPTRCQEFRDFFTINVSEFFRDAEFFEDLRRVWLPLVLEKHPTRNLRIWSAACSIGPEPYSLAMLLEYYFPGQSYNILATDIDRTALAHARQGGPYPEVAFNKLPASLQERYFQKRDNGYYLDNTLQSWITFRPHDLQQGLFGQRYDLVVCRNVIIYFTAQVKRSLYPNLALSLRPGGILFVGGAEFIYHPEQYGLRSLSGPFYTLADK